MNENPFGLLGRVPWIKSGKTEIIPDFSQNKKRGIFYDKISSFIFSQFFPKK